MLRCYRNKRKKYEPSKQGNYRKNDYNIKIDFDVNNNALIRDQTTGKFKNTSCYQNNIYQKLGWQLGFREKKIVLDSFQIR